MKVFVSHVLEDRQLAEELADRLRIAGAEVFISGKDVKLVEDWQSRIEKEMRQSDEVVALFTRNSLNSPNMMLEMGAAYGMHKRVVPISLGVEKDSLMVKALSHKRYTDIEGYVQDVRKRTAETRLNLDRLILVTLKTMQDVSGSAGVSKTRLIKVMWHLLASLPQDVRNKWSVPQVVMYHYGPEPMIEAEALQELTDKGYLKVEERKPGTLSLTKMGRLGATRAAKELAPDFKQSLSQVIEQPARVRRRAVHKSSRT